MRTEIEALIDAMDIKNNYKRSEEQAKQIHLNYAPSFGGVL